MEKARLSDAVERDSGKEAAGKINELGRSCGNPERASVRNGKKS